MIITVPDSLVKDWDHLLDGLKIQIIEMRIEAASLQLRQERQERERAEVYWTNLRATPFYYRWQITFPTWFFSQLSRVGFVRRYAQRRLEA